MNKYDNHNGKLFQNLNYFRLVKKNLKTNTKGRFLGTVLKEDKKKKTFKTSGRKNT